MEYRDDDERRAMTPDDPVGAVVDRLLYPARFQPPAAIPKVPMLREPPEDCAKFFAVFALLEWRAHQRANARAYASHAANLDLLWTPLAELLAGEPPR
jgi:hypothetical protein